MSLAAEGRESELGTNCSLNNSIPPPSLSYSTIQFVFLYWSNWRNGRYLSNHCHCLQNPHNSVTELKEFAPLFNRTFCPCWDWVRVKVKQASCTYRLSPACGSFVWDSGGDSAFIRIQASTLQRKVSWHFNEHAVEIFLCAVRSVVGEWCLI